VPAATLWFTALNYRPERSGNAPYTAGLAEHLAARGHQVTVIAGLPHYPEWRIHVGYRGRMRRTEHIEGVTVRRFAHYVPARQDATRRVLYELTALLPPLVARPPGRPDAIIGVTPQLSGAVLARLLAARFHVPYGLIVQDLAGAGARQSGIAGGARIARVAGAVEAWALRGAARVAIVAECFRESVEAAGVPAERIVRVRNWSQAPPATLSRAEARRRFGFAPDRIICLHAGNMGLKQDLRNVIEAARLAAESDSRLEFVLLGDGSQRSALVALARAYHLPNVRFLPPQPDEAFANLLHAADILLVNQRASLKTMSLPGKLTAYFAASRPVLAAVWPAGETASEVRAAGAGRIVPPGRPALLLEGIRALLAERDGWPAMGERTHSYAATMLSREQALGGYDSFLAELLDPAGRRPVRRGRRRNSD
jgi:colanic acid biosynthesis glycosyl transferase WcaI